MSENAGRKMRRTPEPSAPASHFQGNVADVIETLRNGKVGGAVIPGLASRIGITQERLLEELRLPKSTLKARITQNADLSAMERDRVYRVEKVLVRANDVLEDPRATQPG